MFPYGWFFAITLVAAVVNGALGYGFSSITVPLALLFTSNRTLNPALVPVEVALNGYMLWVNRDAVPGIARRVAPIVIGLVPGVVAGTFVIAIVSPDLLKFGTFLLLLPLILLQAAGIRRPLQSERAIGLPFGAGLGLLYSLTTISGPPLALLFNNQGLAKSEFRAALALVRLAEASLTAAAYAWAGLYTASSGTLAIAIVPSLLIGVPIGAWVIRQMDAEVFRRTCMSFDAWIVGFGISTLLRALHIVDGPAAFSVLAAVGAIDAVLLYRFFTGHRRASLSLSAEPSR
jgi:uncharacterized membrane protein YfcA